jgi:hypothetical protein
LQPIDSTSDQLLGKMVEGEGKHRLFASDDARYLIR